MKRTPISQRTLPTYSRGEEIMNMTTHILGGTLGIAALVLCLIQAQGPLAVFSSILYGGSMIILYTMSSVYHGLPPSMGKKVLQVLDHCTIYLLIAGTYTPIVLCGFLPRYPAIGWGLFFFEWGCAILAAVLTAVDLRKFRVFSMICYIGLGWAVIPFWRQALDVLGKDGFGFLLAGGIAYTVGSVLYGIGSKCKWMHSVFHIFVVLGSFLQFLCIWRWVL